MLKYERTLGFKGLERYERRNMVWGLKEENRKEIGGYSKLCENHAPQSLVQPNPKKY